MPCAGKSLRFLELDEFMKSGGCGANSVSSRLAPPRV
jgi:hypothetical protein